MKPQSLQLNDAKKEFREAVTDLTSHTSFSDGKSYRIALNRRTAAISTLFNQEIITSKLYQELLLSDDLTWIPNPLK